MSKLIASTHLAVGAAAGLAAQGCLPANSGILVRVGVAFIAGIASHLLLDAPPHAEYASTGARLAEILFLEIAVVFVSIFWLSGNTARGLILFFGMSGGALPDIISLAYKNFFQWNWLGKLGGLLHSTHGKLPMGEIGFGAQLVIALGAVMFLRFFATSKIVP